MGVMALICTGEVEAEGSGVQYRCSLRRNFKASLGFVRMRQSQKKKKDHLERPDRGLLPASLGPPHRLYPKPRLSTNLLPVALINTVTKTTWEGKGWLILYVAVDQGGRVTSRSRGQSPGGRLPWLVLSQLSYTT